MYSSRSTRATRTFAALLLATLASGAWAGPIYLSPAQVQVTGTAEVTAGETALQSDTFDLTGDALPLAEFTSATTAGSIGEAGAAADAGSLELELFSEGAAGEMATANASSAFEADFTAPDGAISLTLGLELFQFAENMATAQTQLMVVVLGEAGAVFSDTLDFSGTTEAFSTWSETIDLAGATTGTLSMMLMGATSAGDGGFAGSFAAIDYRVAAAAAVAEPGTAGLLMVAAALLGLARRRVTAAAAAPGATTA